MSGALIRFDLSLPNYFSYPPAPGVDVKPMIPRGEPRSLYIRGEYGRKPDGQMRALPVHNTTHLDVPYHFDEAGADLAAVLNNSAWVADRPCLAKVVHLGGQADLPGSHQRNGVTYCERVSAAVLPGAEELKGYDALVILTGFGRVMAGLTDFQFTPDSDDFYHVPWLDADAVSLILEAGLRLVAIDSTTIEPQTSAKPLRFAGDAHHSLLENDPPVLIMECLNGTDMEAKVGFLPAEGLLHMVPKRAGEYRAEAAHSRAFLYFYRDDPQGKALRQLHQTMTPEEMYG